VAQAQPYIGVLPVKPASDANTADPNAKAAAAPEPNQVALTTVVANLLDAMKRTISQKDNVQQLLTDLQQKTDVATKEWTEAKKALSADVEKYRQDVDKAKADYAALRDQLSQKTQDQMANVEKGLKDEQAKTQQLNDDLEKTKAELNIAQERLKDALDKIAKVEGSADTLVAAQKPDGKIVLVNRAAGTVSINLGSQDRVYPGLTFSVYDRFAGISKDGKPKAEVEVFAIDSKTCTARVLSSDAKNPIATEDIVANLIWDSHKQNQFVIAGDFDLNGDGKPDPDAIGKIRTLIEKWGGVVTDAVSSKTDYVILADAPKVPTQPTNAALQADPTLRDKYDAAQQRLDQYEQIRKQAGSLYIPVLNYERFLYFTGYKTESTRPGAF
jgi:hypothetical protein